MEINKQKISKLKKNLLIFFSMLNFYNPFSCCESIRSIGRYYFGIIMKILCCIFLITLRLIWPQADFTSILPVS